MATAPAWCGAWTTLRSPASPTGRLALAQTVCLQADEDTVETTTATAPPLAAGQPFYLRVAVRAGARCQFSYSADGRQFTPLGSEFTAREGKRVGARLGLFCLSANAKLTASTATADWWHVAP